MYISPSIDAKKEMFILSVLSIAGEFFICILHLCWNKLYFEFEKQSRTVIDVFFLVFFFFQQTSFQLKKMSYASSKDVYWLKYSVAYFSLAAVFFTYALHFYDIKVKPPILF